MGAFNRGTSTYHSIQGLYWRNSTGDLLAVEGSNSDEFPEIWTHLRKEILASESKWSHTTFKSGKQIDTLLITADIPELQYLRDNFPPERGNEALVTKVAEVKHANGLILGMLTSRPQSLADDALGAWAENFILLETEFQPHAQLTDSASPAHLALVEKVSGIFENTMKNVSKNDQWELGGKEVFMNRVYGFVEKNIPILLALPAFPCKSPNPSKVGGTMPDLAEHIALDVLRNFVKEVNKVYQPGATLWVISDGHVFSDCIGVDDDMIDTYDAAMVQVYKKKFPVEEGPVPAISFKGLQDIFKPNSDSMQALDASLFANSQMPHPVNTKLTASAEMCRKLMFGVAEADRGVIRSCIDQHEPDTIQLYRGQTRFMQEDLAKVPAVSNLSNKQKKKTAALVAQEMISRNQAYSNLVELLLPNYVRLSIHAHNNAGPKFAVRLLPKSLVRPIESLEDRHEPVPAYEFQIPTPWHNSIIKVEGDELMYLARADVARDAFKEGTDFEGSWVDGPDGSYFSLRRKVAPAKELPDLDTFDTFEKPVLKKRPTLVITSPVIEMQRLQRRSTVLDSPMFEKRGLKRRPTVIESPIVGNPVFEVDSDEYDSPTSEKSFDRELSKSGFRLLLSFTPIFHFTSFLRTIWRFAMERVY